MYLLGYDSIFLGAPYKCLSDGILIYDFKCEIFVPNFSLLLLQIENQLKALKEKAKESPAPEPEPEPTTEVLFLCSYEGCGKTFIDAGALRKHSHIHGERQYVCHYEGCGKVLTIKFLYLFYFMCPMILWSLNKTMNIEMYLIVSKFSFTIFIFLYNGVQVLKSVVFLSCRNF